MTAATLLLHLQDMGIRLGCVSDELYADVLPGVGLGSFEAVIRERKADLLDELRLRARIVGVATVSTERFDRAKYDALWKEWRDLQRRQDVHPRSLEVGDLQCQEVRS